GVGPSACDLGDVVHLHAAVDFEQDVAAALDDAAARLGQLGQRLGNEPLAAEAGVNRHDENEVQLVHDVVQPVQGRGRVQHQPGLAAVLADQAEGAVDV